MGGCSFDMLETKLTKLVIGFHQIFSDQFGWPTFNMMSFDHVHQFPVFK